MLGPAADSHLGAHDVGQVKWLLHDGHEGLAEVGGYEHVGHGQQAVGPEGLDQQQAVDGLPDGSCERTEVGGAGADTAHLWQVKTSAAGSPPGETGQEPGPTLVTEGSWEGSVVRTALSAFPVMVIRKEPALGIAHQNAAWSPIQLPAMAPGKTQVLGLLHPRGGGSLRA